MSKGMIEMGGMYIHPYSVVAIADHSTLAGIIEGKCEIWCGPAEGDHFVVPIPKEEAVKLINDWLEEDGI